MHCANPDRRRCIDGKCHCVADPDAPWFLCCFFVRGWAVLFKTIKPWRHHTCFSYILHRHFELMTQWYCSTLLKTKRVTLTIGHCTVKLISNIMSNSVKTIVFYAHGFDTICSKNTIYTILRTILDSTYTTVNFKLVFFKITCICYNTFTILHPALKVTKIVYRNSCCIINLKSEYHTLITITFQLQKKT